MDDTYPDDFFLLQKQITARRLDDLVMQAAIIANPHKKPEDAQEFIDDLLKQRRYYRGEDDIPPETDFEAIASLKEMMQKQSKVIKAK